MARSVSLILNLSKFCLSCVSECTQASLTAFASEPSEIIRRDYTPGTSVPVLTVLEAIRIDFFKVLELVADILPHIETHNCEDLNVVSEGEGGSPDPQQVSSYDAFQQTAAEISEHKRTCQCRFRASISTFEQLLDHVYMTKRTLKQKRACELSHKLRDLQKRSGMLSETSVPVQYDVSLPDRSPGKYTLTYFQIDNSQDCGFQDIFDQLNDPDISMQADSIDQSQSLFGIIPFR